MGHAPGDGAVRAVTAGGNATRRVVVLGAGAAGLAAANRLALYATRDALALEVVLVDASAEHVFAPGFVSVMFDDAAPEQFRRPIASLVRPGIEVVQGRIERIDPARREVSGEPGTLGYDVLVVALGADVGWPGGPPVEETAPWTAAGAAGGAALLRRLRPGERVVVVPATPAYRCPPAAFDLAVRIRRRTRAEVTVAHPWPRPLAPFGEEPARRFEAMLEDAGVAFASEFALAEAAPGTVRSAGGVLLETDAAVVVPPHRPPEVVARSPLAGEGGWMACTYPSLSHPSFPEVYGIGDVVAPVLGVGMAGTLGLLEGAFVARRIAEAAGGPVAADAPEMSAICFVDQGTTGSLLHCDFTGPASRSGPARCTLLPDMAFFRAAKRLFAEHWFETTLGGDVG